MTRLNSLFLLLLFSLTAVSAQVERSFFVDFGPDDVTNGNITPGPDANGKYWNNPTDGSVSGNSTYLVTKDNEASEIYIEVKAVFSTAGITDGGLLAPDGSQLGELAIATATQDYFFTTSSAGLEIGGLNPDYGYVFYFFASCNSAQTRWSRFTLSGTEIIADSLQTSGSALGGAGYDGNISTVLKTDTIVSDSEGKIQLQLEVAAGDLACINCMRIDEIPGSGGSGIFCPVKENYLIAMMGSSVAYGTGASSNHGYAWMYNELLKERYTSGLGAGFVMKNISVGGNSTVDLLGRWDSDLLPLCSKYVIYGVSLGNEGIHDQGESMFIQFRDNMLLLIQKAREQGIEPVVVNCYTRGDFNTTDYAFIREMNLLIHKWDVPSINVLGAIDNGAGRWASGYMYDSYHPNTAGHKEFMYSMVPSLFDALDAGKLQPVRQGTTSISINPAPDNFQLEVVPEAIVHPFTTSFGIRTTGSGVIASVILNQNACLLSVSNSTGCLNYLSPALEEINGTTVINDGEWHQITFSHFYARGESELYVDNVLQGTVAEKLIPVKFVLGGENAPHAEFREWFIYRSGLNQDEVVALSEGAMLKSSLEIYAPLNGLATAEEEQLANLAQSTNQVNKATAQTYAVTGYSGFGAMTGTAFTCYPNPGAEEMTFSFDLSGSARVNLTLSDLAGRVVKTFCNDVLVPGSYEFLWNGDCDSGSKAESGYYLAKLRINNLSEARGVVFTK